MKSGTVYSIVLFILLSLSCANEKELFQKGTDDWIEKGDATWQINDQEIIGSLVRGTGFIMTKDTYKDFELELEFNPDGTINSGIFIRCKDYTLSYTDCYEINIWDEHPEQKDRTGAIVSRTTPLEQIETIGKWNTYKIKADKNHIQAWINGILVADLENDDLQEGYIGLQAAQIGTIKFRNVKLKTL